MSNKVDKYLHYALKLSGGLSIIWGTACFLYDKKVLGVASTAVGLATIALSGLWKTSGDNAAQQYLDLETIIEKDGHNIHDYSPLKIELQNNGKNEIEDVKLYLPDILETKSPSNIFKLKSAVPGKTHHYEFAVRPKEAGRQRWDTKVKYRVDASSDWVVTTSKNWVDVSEIKTRTGERLLHKSPKNVNITDARTTIQDSVLTRSRVGNYK